MKVLLMSLAILALPGAGPLAPAGGGCGIVRVQGDVVHCCALSNGAVCCAQSLEADGTVAGCGCRPQQ